VYKSIARVDVDDIAFSSSLFSVKVDNTDGLNQLQMDAFGCTVQGSFLLICSQKAVTVVEAAAAEIEWESLMQRILQIGLFIDLYANTSSVDS